MAVATAMGAEAPIYAVLTTIPCKRVLPSQYTSSVVLMAIAEATRLPAVGLVAAILKPEAAITQTRLPRDANQAPGRVRCHSLIPEPTPRRIRRSRTAGLF